jgi:hypothetical protein
MRDHIFNSLVRHWGDDQVQRSIPVLAGLVSKTPIVCMEDYWEIPSSKLSNKISVF